MGKPVLISVSNLKVVGIKVAKKYKGNLFYVGKKVKINVESLIKQSKLDKSYSEKYEKYLSDNRDTLFTIEMLHTHYDSIVLDTFPHMLELSDLIV